MRILITGGTGSLGRALVKRLRHDPLVERLCVLSRDEHKIAALAATAGPTDTLRWFVGDVRDRERLTHACRNVDAVIHAAALKRVDAIVNDPGEIEKTNVGGTVNVLHAALEAGVRKVLLISSDKAVMPCNAYGASKQAAEWRTVGFNAFSMPRGMRCAAVRYGNVLGSTGSVVHVWAEAMRHGQTLPITDERMTRFHITLPQAVDFILSALQRMHGGEIFVPLLPSVRLVDLAAAVAPGWKQDRIGLRPGGEKLHEQLLSDEEVGRTVLDRDRYVIRPSHRTWAGDQSGGVPYTGPVYRSDVNHRWMTIHELQQQLQELS